MSQNHNWGPPRSDPPPQGPSYRAPRGYPPHGHSGHPPAGWGEGWHAPQHGHPVSRQGPPYPPYPAPQPYAWSPPRRRRGGGVLVALLVASGVVALIAFFALSLMGGLLSSVPGVPERVPTPPPVTLSPPEEPETPLMPPDTDPDDESWPPGWVLPERTWPEIPPATSSDPNWMVVQTSPLYATSFPEHTGCPAPAYAYTHAEMEGYITQQMACIQQAWKDVQRELGFSTQDIPVHFYQGSGINSACGYVEAPAFYCSADGGAIYFGQGTLDWGSFQIFGMKDMAAHEYGHHLQAQAGFFEAMYYLGDDDEIVRRSELQATCFGQGMIGRDDSFVMDEEYYFQLTLKHQQVVEDGTHGSNASNDFWGFRGLYATSLSECNTWTSPSSDVD